MENRQQALYWAELTELKVACEYIRLYRDHLVRVTNRMTLFRGAVSIIALGTWIAVKSYPIVWGAVITASQMTELLQQTIPITQRQRGANALCATLDAIFIDAQMEWEDIYGGKLDEDDIKRRRHRLMKLRHEAAIKNLPDGLPLNKSLFRLAEIEAAAYIKKSFLR
jgi:hypothetical protein